jgi:carbon monoxide dehydrogenase subunit G
VIVQERFAIAAPPARVWDFFLDVPQVSACMPGVGQVEQVDDRTYRGQVAVKVGPLKTGFAMTVTIDDLQPPERIALTARGTDRGTGSLVQTGLAVMLSPTESGETEVAYDMEIALRGALGRFGQSVIGDTARKMSAQFVACVRQALATTPDEGGDA